MAALRFRPLNFFKHTWYVHPEVSHYAPSTPTTVARCTAKAREGADGMVDSGFVSYLLA